MQIDWKKYVKLARDKDLSSSQLTQVIRKETHQRVHISEVRRQLFTGGFEETVSGNGSASEVSIIDLSEASDICQRTLKIKVGNLRFEFETESPETSVLMILSGIGRES